MLYIFGLISLLITFLLFILNNRKNKNNKDKNIKLYSDNLNTYFNVINNLNGYNEKIKIAKNDIENLFYLKKCNDIHLEIIDNNYSIAETLSVIKGKRNYTFFPIKMENAIMKKYLNTRVSYEIMSIINTLNTIYNLSIEIKKNNKIIIKGFLSDFIELYKNNNKFIIEIYRNKYIVDTSCMITIYEIKFFPNKSYNC